MPREGQCNVCGEVRKLAKSHKKCHPCLYKARKARIQDRCLDCNKLISVHTQTKLCKSCGRKGERHPFWKGGTLVNSDGYRLVTFPGHPNAHKGSGYVLEHIVVMSERLGRPLLSEENVHHINGVRDDNRPENLELWSIAQPPGQRVVDKVAWAKQILALYGEDFTDADPMPRRVESTVIATEASAAIVTAITELRNMSTRLEVLAERITSPTGLKQ
ncbi:HNH endonuclease [Streptomyces sp. NBC_01238]|uniref:HNH endonuclease n=1 Tax=Streptomyces sp. NBC_01238 TaxID=2903791 RepID=UPI002F91810D